MFSISYVCSQDYTNVFLSMQVDGEMEELIKPLPWYPGKFAWHLNFSRMQLRKNQTLARFQN